MGNLEFISEIKKNKNINLEDIVNVFIEKKVSKYQAFVLIRDNFNYKQLEIMYYLNLLYKDEEPNPFNEDFMNCLKEE
ncbi:uncharacterized membrane protein YgaE (UPF0421/DUF939 family) [Chryseobacterium defluvii]|uniref:Uncharacterized membrane protein YgaE (UPF0421/DUF939 family) n=1 Tax=Chryseobacterium defluvii TaxID=160396 RepID=A0A840KL94_9FLAO|nr:hypothetical protein [Chryseobacterium defluvii]MBB4808260.1 uncharacterized membrane protein YgaE (UPF0421/DUF939 family) [Chryseobacterium defluvii]